MNNLGKNGAIQTSTRIFTTVHIYLCTKQSW